MHRPHGLFPRHLVRAQRNAGRGVWNLLARFFCHVSKRIAGLAASAIEKSPRLDGKCSIADVAIHDAVCMHLNLNGPQITFDMTCDGNLWCGHVALNETALTDSELGGIAGP